MQQDLLGLLHRGSPDAAATPLVAQNRRSKSSALIRAKTCGPPVLAHLEHQGAYTAGTQERAGKSRIDVLFVPVGVYPPQGSKGVGEEQSSAESALSPDEEGRG